MKVDDKVKHFKILQGEEGLFYVELNQTFTDLEALVKYYRGHSLSVVAQITEACARVRLFMLPA